MIEKGDYILEIEITTFDIFDNFCIAWICFASYLWGNVPKIPLGIGRIWAKPLIEWVGESFPFHQKEMSDSGELNQTPRVLYCWEIPSLYLFFWGGKFSLGLASMRGVGCCLEPEEVRIIFNYCKLLLVIAGYWRSDSIIHRTDKNNQTMSCSF